MAGHFYPLPPTFIGGRQPYEPKLGIAQSAPSQPTRALATLGVILASWTQATPALPNQVRIAPLIPAVSVPGPRLSTANFNVILAQWQPAYVPLPQRVDVAPLIPVVAVTANPPYTRKQFDNVDAAWRYDQTIVISLTSIAPFADPPAAPDAAPIKGWKTVDVIVRQWIPREYLPPQPKGLAWSLPEAVSDSPPPTSFARLNVLLQQWAPRTWWPLPRKSSFFIAGPDPGPAVAVTFRTLINLTDEGGEVYAATAAGTSQGARGYTDPAILPSGANGWIEASKGANGDGAIVLTLDAAVPGNVTFGAGDFICQVATAGGLAYGVNTSTLTSVPTYVLPESLLSLIRLRRFAGTVTFESSEDGGATWTVRNTFAGTSTAALVPRWYTTYSVTPRRIYRPRASGLVDAIGNAIQGQWVAPNITATTDWLYVGTAGLAGQYYITRMSRTTLVGVTTTLATDESDDHNVPAIIETNTGKIMVAFATHSLDLFVRSRLSATADLDDWGSVRTLTTSDTATYMQMHRLAGQDRIWMLYRIGSSSAGDWVIRYSDDEGATWSTERVLAENTYVISVMDPDGVHIRCFAYAHPQVGSDHDIYYFRVNLSTGDVIDSEGTVYGNVVDDTGLPITEAEEHKAVDVTAPTTTRMYELGRIGVPQMLGSEFIDDSSGTYIRYVYDTATGLFTRQPIVSSGPVFYTSYFGGACFDETDTDVVYCSRNVGGVWELARMVTADGGDTWTVDAIMRTTNKIIARPQVRHGLLWWSEIPIYNDYTSFASSALFVDAPADSEAAPLPSAVNLGVIVAQWLKPDLRLPQASRIAPLIQSTPDSPPAPTDVTLRLIIDQWSAPAQALPLARKIASLGASLPTQIGQIPNRAAALDSGLHQYDLAQYFTGATTYAIDPAVEAGWSFDSVSGELEVDTDVEDIFGPYTITASNVQGDTTGNAFTVNIYAAGSGLGSKRLHFGFGF